MKKILLLIFVVYSPFLMAQQVVSTAGGVFGNEHGSLSYTIGEGVIQTVSNGGKTLTQGFQQTSMIILAIAEVAELDFTITCYPNPTNNIVRLEIGKINVTGYHIQIFDLNGKLLSTKKLDSNSATINFQYLNSGIYLLKVNDSSQELKTFKIIKN